jgi:hypothetical protein
MKRMPRREFEPIRQELIRGLGKVYTEVVPFQVTMKYNTSC